MQESNEDEKVLRFFKMPKSLFTDPTYKGLSNTAKLVYMLLLDRLQLSIQNDWTDDDGNYYVYFNQADIREKLHIARATCTKALRDLDCYGLIQSKRQGAGKPNKLFLLNFKNCTSDSRVSNSSIHEFQNLGIMNTKKQDSRVSNSGIHEFQNLGRNDTEYSKTEKLRLNGERADKSANAPQKESRRFQPPTIQEVQAYCAERCNQVDAEQFVDFYTAKGWHVGKTKMKDWKAAVRTWEKRDKQHGRYHYHQENKQAAIDTVNHLMRKFEAEESAENARTNTISQSEEPDQNTDVENNWDAAISVW